MQGEIDDANNNDGRTLCAGLPVLPHRGNSLTGDNIGDPLLLPYLWGRSITGISPMARILRQEK
jgi:hypothetical protein